MPRVIIAEPMPASKMVRGEAVENTRISATAARTRIILMPLERIIMPAPS